METTEEDWRLMRERVRKNYEEHRVAEDLVEQFTVHNRQVEDFVAKFSEAENFNDKEKEIAILCSILHDATKGYGDFLEHGKEGGEFAKALLGDMGFSEDLAESVRLGIERHMGREGYVAARAKEKYGNDFEYSSPRTKVGQLVYVCDILTQITEEGFNKILTIRKADPDCIRADMAVAEEKGISAAAAARLSALESAKKSYEIIMEGRDYPMESVRAFAQELWIDLQEKI